MPLGRRPIQTIDAYAGREYALAMRARVLVELGDSEAVDLFLREEDAERALMECLCDEPQWAGLLRVAPVGLDEREASPN
jgi:hypothetical protein